MKSISPDLIKPKQAGITFSRPDDTKWFSAVAFNNEFRCFCGLGARDHTPSLDKAVSFLLRHSVSDHKEFLRLVDLFGFLLGPTGGCEPQMLLLHLKKHSDCGN
jgi:hypothetical protein